MAVAIVAVLVTAVLLVGLAARSDRVDTGPLWRGVSLSFGAGFVVMVVCTLAVGVALINLLSAGAFAIGFVWGIGVGGSVLVLGSAFAAGGLLLGRGELWASTAWLVGPLTSLAFVFAFERPIESVLHRLELPDPSATQIYRSEVSLTLARNDEPSESWTLTGGCDVYPRQTLVKIYADNGQEDEARVGINLELSPDPAAEPLNGHVSIQVGAWSPSTAVLGPGDPSTGNAEFQPGWSIAAGHVDVSDLVPFGGSTHTLDPAIHWSGGLTWACSERG